MVLCGQGMSVGVLVGWRCMGDGWVEVEASPTAGECQSNRSEVAHPSP